MGADAGFDMVPPLSTGTVDKEKWATFLAAVKKVYEDDDKVHFKPHCIEFMAGEHPLLPVEGHKLLRFSSKVTGCIVSETRVEDYLNTVTTMARSAFGGRVQRWNELCDRYGFYDWTEVHASIASYSQPEHGDCALTSSTPPDNNVTSAKIESLYFEVVPVPGKGKGLVARVDITKGTRILCEKPLLTARNSLPALLHQDLIPKVKALSQDQQRQFLSLHNNFPGKYAFSGIVKTNALPCGSGASIGGIYPTICLINHSCLPNSHNNWNDEKEHETIHATRNIQAGEEITIAYNGGDPYTVRQAAMKSAFGFECNCSSCSLPPAELQASDTRRLEMQRLDDAIGDSTRMSLNPAASLADCHSMVQIVDKEYGEGGAAVAILARVYYDAFQVCIAHGDQARALVFAERSHGARVVCEGHDSPVTKRIKGLVNNPASHTVHGLASMRWKATKTRVPKNLNDAEFEKWLWREGR